MHELRCSGYRPQSGGRSAQLGYLEAAVVIVICRGIDRSAGQVGEPPIDGAPLGAHEVRLVSEERDGAPVLGERLSYGAHDLGRGVSEAVKNAHESGADMAAGARPGGNRMSGEKQQVVAFVNGESQGTSERSDHLLGWLWAGTTLQAGEVIGGHVREVGDFLTSQTCRSTSLASSEADVLRLQRFAASPDKRSDCNLIHGQASSG